MQSRLSDFAWVDFASWELPEATQAFVWWAFGDEDAALFEDQGADDLHGGRETGHEVSSGDAKTIRCRALPGWPGSGLIAEEVWALEWGFGSCGQIEGVHDTALHVRGEAASFARALDGLVGERFFAGSD